MTNWTHSLNPYLIHTQSFQLTYYWAFYPLSFFIIFFLCYRRREVFSISSDALISLFMWGWAGMLVGAKLGYVLFYQPAYFAQHPLHAFAFQLGGMSFHGALLGGIAGIWWSARRHGLAFLTATDLLVVFIPLGLFLGRIGNFIGGELVGRPTSISWGVIFPQVDNIPRHPSQLYEALLEGLLLFTLLFVYRQRIWRLQGRMTATFLIIYSGLRFGVEFFREPDPQLGYLLGNWTMGQVLCLPLLLSGLYVYYKSASHVPENNLLSGH